MSTITIDYVPRVTANEVRARLDSGAPMLLVGVLPSETFKKYRLPGAISAEEFRHRLPELSRDTDIVTY